MAVMSSVPAAECLLSGPSVPDREILDPPVWGLGMGLGLPRKNSLVSPAAGSHDLRADQISK